MSCWRQPPPTVSVTRGVGTQALGAAYRLLGFGRPENGLEQGFNGVDFVPKPTEEAAAADGLPRSCILRNRSLNLEKRLVFGRSDLQAASRLPSKYKFLRRHDIFLTITARSFSDFTFMRPSSFSAESAIGRAKWHPRRSSRPCQRYSLSCVQVLEQTEGGVGKEDRVINEASTMSSKVMEEPVVRHDVPNKGPDSLSLPLSPLMDQGLLRARNRYRNRKTEPSSEPTEFQKKLLKNPYAQALATPVRSCSLTNVRLPSHFLLDFGLAPHPRTGKPWQIPKLALDPNVTTPGDASKFDRPASASYKDDVATNPSGSSTKRPARAVAGNHVISQKAAITFVSNIKRKSFFQMVPHRWKLDTRFKTDDLVWREDMDDFILELMRKKAVKLLQYLSSRPSAYIVKCEGYEDIQNKQQPGAVLWLGKPENEEILSTGEEPPPPYAMVKYRSAHHLPLYNLPAILGMEYLRQLRVSSNNCNEALAVIKQKRNTLDLLMHLWKLMGYITHESTIPQLEKSALTHEIT